MKKIVYLLGILLASCGDNTSIPPKPRYKYKIVGSVSTDTYSTDTFTIKGSCIYFKDYNYKDYILCGTFSVVKK